MVIVPYTRPHEPTAAALEGREWVAVFVGAKDDAYWEVLHQRWAAGDTFTIIEHDITPGAEALDSLDQCLGDWCTCPYPYMGGEHAGLGCTRFRSDLIARHPDLLSVVAEMADERHPPKHWCRLDAWIRNTLVVRGEMRCETHPTVVHRGGQAAPSPAHGCC